MSVPLLISTASPEEEDDCPLPHISEPGFILVKVGSYLHPEAQYQAKHEYEVLDYSGGTFWIREGIGFEYWFEWLVDFPKEGGIFVIENVHGKWIKGEWGISDDDEEWFFDTVRPATAKEIKNETVRAKGDNKWLRVISDIKARLYSLAQLAGWKNGSGKVKV